MDISDLVDRYLARSQSNEAQKDHTFDELCEEYGIEDEDEDEIEFVSASDGVDMFDMLDIIMDDDGIILEEDDDGEEFDEIIYIDDDDLEDDEDIEDIDEDDVVYFDDEDK